MCSWKIRWTRAGKMKRLMLKMLPYNSCIYFQVDAWIFAASYFGAVCIFFLHFASQKILKKIVFSFLLFSNSLDRFSEVETTRNVNGWKKSPVQLKVCRLQQKITVDEYIKWFIYREPQKAHCLRQFERKSTYVLDFQRN